MKQFARLLIIMTLLACSVASAVLSTAANKAVDRAAELAMQPPSAVDMVMRSRETAPEAAGSNGLMVVGFLAVAVLIGGGIVFLMRGGSEFLRQGRLTLRAWQRPATAPAPRLEQLPAGQWGDAASVPTVRRPAQLPYHDDIYSD